MKKLLGLMMAVVMVLCFAGCGDSSSSTDATEENAAAPEPNTGIRGIVYTLPDGWEQAEGEGDSYAIYENPDSNLTIAVSIIDQEILSEMGGEKSTKAVEEYYNEYYSYTDEYLKEMDADIEKAEVCGTDTNTIKFKNGDKGYVDLGTSWLMDDVIYSINLFNPEAYDNEGNLQKDAKVMSDEDIALYESVLKSIQPGDGSKYQTSDN